MELAFRADPSGWPPFLSLAVGTFLLYGWLPLLLPQLALGMFWILLGIRIVLARQRCRETSPRNQPRKRVDIGCQRRDWFEALAFFIPKGIREPWHGDLLEDRGRLQREGYPRVLVEIATAVQLLVLMAFWLKDELVSSLGLRTSR